MVIIITIFLTVLTPVFSRSPAVEPVTGLDIDQYQDKKLNAKEVEQSRYNWDSQNQPTRITHPSEGLIKNNSHDLIQNYLLTALIFLIPLSLWPIINKKIKKNETTLNRRNQSEDPTVARIHDRRKKESSLKEDVTDDAHHVDKAS